MKVLHLTLKKKWFDMIDSGDKKEEYREIKQYWMTRLLSERKGIEADKYPWAIGFYDGKFKEVEFRNGYSKVARRMRFAKCQISVNTGRPEWGAEPGKKYFVIKLGERVELNKPIALTAI